MNLGILNTVIAMVIVLLVLSLLVQAIQTLIKKLLKLKSHQIEGSLKDLYDQAIAGTAATTTTGVLTNGDQASPAAEQFTSRVLGEFKKIGRVTAFGRPVLDSLSKEDLFKVMGKLESEEFFPDYAAKFQGLCNQIINLRKAIEDLTNNEALRGAASARVAEIRAILAPIFNNVQAILEGDQVKPRVLFADLLRLGKLDIHGVLNLLNEAQRAVVQEKEIAAKAGAGGEVKQFEALSDELAKIAKLIGDLSQKFDDAVSPLRNKLEQVEVWFDTVTQSFDERYARHMRTVSIYISIVVVILLNANFFSVYRDISTNEVQRNLIVENGPQVLEKARQARQQAAAASPAAAPPAAAPLASSSPVPASLAAAASTAAFPQATPIPSPSASPLASPVASPTGPTLPIATPSASPVNVKDEIEQSRQEIEVLVSTYEGFGFSPLSGEQVESFLQSLGFWTGLQKPVHGQRGWWGFTLARNDKGVVVNQDNIPIPVDCQEVDKDGNRILAKNNKPMNCTPAWRLQSRGEWWASRKGDVVNLIGWAIMVMLLSVGAPFWQDTLESLFGIKNLLRQRSGTQNIETQSGAGQPKE